MSESQIKGIKDFADVGNCKKKTEIKGTRYKHAPARKKIDKTVVLLNFKLTNSSSTQFSYSQKLYHSLIVNDKRLLQEKRN